MKIVFNTHKPAAAASLFYANEMKNLPEIVFGDFDHYANYDVALFMTYDDDLPEMRRARSANPELRIGLLDARSSKIWQYLDVIDFFVLDSIEMSDFWAEANRPIFIYPDIPAVPLIEKKHVDKKKIVIGYHGNKPHLAGMFREVAPAIDVLGRDIEVELMAVYDLKQGRCELGLPRDVPVRHVQWHENVYVEEMSGIDIGIAPALMPVKNLEKIKRATSYSTFFADNNDDYLVRYKMPSNDGRAAVFGFLGIPVVADMLPSFMQLIHHGENGFIAHHCGGWYLALKNLAFSADLRNRIAASMRTVICEKFDFERINREFVAFLSTVSFASRQAPLNFSAIKTERRAADNAALRRIIWRQRKFKALKLIAKTIKRS